MEFQDVLDELQFNKYMSISIIDVGHYFKEKFSGNDLKCLLSSLKFFDANKNGNTNYMEIFDFFMSTKSTKNSSEQAVFNSANFKSGLNKNLKNFINQQNSNLMKNDIHKGISNLLNKKGNQSKLDGLSEKELIERFKVLLKKLGRNFQEIIEELDYDSNLDVPMVEIKTYFKEITQEKDDLRLALKVIQHMDINKNGNINYSEFMDFLNKLNIPSSAPENSSSSNTNISFSAFISNIAKPTKSQEDIQSNENLSASNHKFKFDKKFSKINQQKLLSSIQKPNNKGSLIKKASSTQNSIFESLKSVIPEIQRSGSNIISDNCDKAVYKLKLLNAYELNNLKDASDHVFSYSNEIGFLNFQNLLKQAEIKMKMSEALAIFKLIDHNDSHRICKMEFEEFIVKTLSELESADTSGSNTARQENNAELSKTLFRSKIGQSHGSTENFGSTFNKNLQNGMNKFVQSKINEMSTVNLKTEDIFKQLPDINEKKYMTFQHIFSCPFAALKSCLEITRNLEREGNALFCDPEFGPNERDKYGVKSIYFSETLPGYPQPEDMNWLRPSEIVPSNGKIVIYREISLFKGRSSF
jgi:hypothetical protein